MKQLKHFGNFFLLACVLMLLPSCDDTNSGVLINGIVRNYDGLDLNSCGWVIEIQNDDGGIEVLLPLNLDSFFEQDNLFVVVDFNETMGITACTVNGLFIQAKDIIINRIE